MRKKLAGIVVVGLVGLVASCGGGSGDSATSGAEDDNNSVTVSEAVMKQTLDRAVVASIAPFYGSFASISQQMAEQADLFCVSRSALDFTSLKRTWLDTMQAWQRATIISTGAIAVESRDLRIEAWPAASAADVGVSIEQLLDAPAPISVATIAQEPVQRQGLPALEYLLFDGRSAADFDASLSGNRRCSLLQAVAENLANITATTNDAWNGPNSESTTSAQKLISEDSKAIDGYAILINQLLAILIETKDNRLGPTLGFASNNSRISTNPGAAQSPRSDSSLKNIIVSLEAFSQIFSGNDGSSNSGFGLDNILAQTGQQVLSDQLTQMLSGVLATARQLDMNATLGTAESSGRLSEFEALYAKIRTLETRFQVSGIPALGTTIRFNFNDGD